MICSALNPKRFRRNIKAIAEQAQFDGGVHLICKDGSKLMQHPPLEHLIVTIECYLGMRECPWGWLTTAGRVRNGVTLNMAYYESKKAVGGVDG